MPVTPPLSHPAILLATWFGCGLIKPAPGTWGTLAALPFAWGMSEYFGPDILFGAFLLIFILGCYCAHIYSKITNSHDASEIVIDEVAGMWLTLAFVPMSLDTLVAGFIVFRLFDIFKPWPIIWLDKNISGGLGIMIDDMLAGLFAGLILLLAVETGGLDYVFG